MQKNYKQASRIGNYNSESFPGLKYRKFERKNKFFWLKEGKQKTAFIIEKGQIKNVLDFFPKKEKILINFSICLEIEKE